jgi:hypothetical protein
MTKNIRLAALTSIALALGFGGFASAQSMLDSPSERGRLSCGEAANLIQNRGLSDIVPLSCTGQTYKFDAKDGGRLTSVYVDSLNGYVDVPDAESIDNDHRR